MEEKWKKRWGGERKREFLIQSPVFFTKVEKDNENVLKLANKLQDYLEEAFLAMESSISSLQNRIVKRQF